MPKHGMDTTETRPLRDAERELIFWLLSRGGTSSTRYLLQATQIRAVSQCSCGCGNLDFDIEGEGLAPPGGMTILVERRWTDRDGHLFGVYIYSTANRLAGIEAYSIDGLATPRTLPTPQELTSAD